MVGTCPVADVVLTAMPELWTDGATAGAVACLLTTPRSPCAGRNARMTVAIVALRLPECGEEVADGSQ